MNWFGVSAKKRSKGQRSKSNKATQYAPQQSFILEPLITPSGLVDSVDHAPHALAEDWYSSALPEVHLSEHSLDHASVGHLDTSDFHRVTEAVENHHTTKVGSHSHSVTHSTHASASDTVETHNDVVRSGDTHIFAAHTVDVPISEHELEPLPFIHTQESTDGHPASGAEVASTAIIAHPNPTFTSGVFTVGTQGQVSLDYLFDGGYYQGQVAIFNLDMMDQYVPGSPEFIHEAAHRALSNSDLGHVVISDATEGARFSGSLSGESNFNSGEYQGVRSFSMRAGDTFGIMLVPNSTVQQVFEGNTEGDVHPLFSMASANPNEAFHVGQIADVTNNGHTFVMEDMRVDAGSDHDYNDIIFQVRGATGTAAHLDDVIDHAHDWRNTDMGHALIAYSKPYDQTSDHTPVDTHSTVTSDSVHSDTVEQPWRHVHSRVTHTHTTIPTDSVHSDAVVTTGDGHTTVPTDSVHSDAVVTPPVDTHSSVTSGVVSGPVSIGSHPSQQPLIGVIDTGFSANNPDINYSHVTLGHDYVAGDANPLLQPGEGNEHGTHVLGIIAATKDNGIGIDGINDQAPIWLGRATGSGHWADSLVEFVNHAKDSGQPNAVVNLSLDLTQVNPDGSVTTRYEFTPQERAAIEYARQYDVLIVVAAGNDGGVMSALGQASQEFDNIITVGSAHDFDPTHTPAEGFGRADYSSYGYGLDIMADGGTTDNPVLSTVGNGVGTMAGTSVAAAEVTGGVSQVWAANPDLSYRQVIELLKLTATDLNTPNWDTETGAGLLNITAAVHLAKVTEPEPYTPVPFSTPTNWGGEGQVTPTERAAVENQNLNNTVGYDGTSTHQTYIKTFNRNGGSSALGSPINNVHPWGDGYTQDFSSGSEGRGAIMKSNANDNSYWVGGDFWKTFLQFNSVNGLLKYPTSDRYSTNGGLRQDFQGGAILKSSKGIFPVYGGIGYYYLNNEGGQIGRLGFPTSGEIGIGNGIIVQHFENGDIIYGDGPTRTVMKGQSTPTSETINGYTVSGKFYPVFKNYRGTLGNPISGVTNHSSGASYQLFQNGSIVSSQYGTYPLYGGIRQTYLKTGGLDGWLGAPKSAEIGQGNGVIIQYFENGYIIWNGRTATAYQTGDNSSSFIPDSIPAKSAVSWGGIVDSSIKGSVVSDILDAVNRGVIRQEVGFFLMSILATESSGGNWHANNGLGYLGAFQMGPAERHKFAPGVSDEDFLASKDIQLKAAQGLYDEKLQIIANLAQTGQLHHLTTEPNQQPLDEHFAGKSDLYKAAYAWLNLAGVDGNHVYSKDYAEAAEETAQLIHQTLHTEPKHGAVGVVTISATPIDSNQIRLQKINAALDKFNGVRSITDPNGNYPGECVSFVKQFTKELGINMGPMGGNGGAKYGFINFNQPGLSLSASQADKINFTGNEQPEVGDIIFFNSTSSNRYGHVAVVQSVLGDGRVVIEESNGDKKAPNTSVRRSVINLKSNPPASGYGPVMGWLRLKL